MGFFSGRCSISFFMSTRRGVRRFQDFHQGGSIRCKSLLFPPICRESSRTGGGEDGLAEAFEEDGDFGQALLAGFHFRQQLLQFGDDPALFGEGRKHYANI